MSKQDELIQAFAEKWTAQKWGWEVDVMNEEYKEFISDLRTLLSQLVPGEEENFPLAFIDWLGENFLWDKYMRYYVPRDTDMENAKYLKTVKEAYYYWMSLTD